MEILSAEEFREKTGHILKGTNHFAESYAKYLLEKQAEFLDNYFEENSYHEYVIKASNEFIKQLK